MPFEAFYFNVFSPAIQSPETDHFSLKVILMSRGRRLKLLRKRVLTNMLPVHDIVIDSLDNRQYSLAWNVTQRFLHCIL
jgi:hypothetical protein